MVYIATNVTTYEVVNTSGSDIGYVKVKVPIEESVIFDVGDCIDVYLYGKKVKRAIVRYLKKIAIALYELYGVGEEDSFQRQFVRVKIVPEMVGKEDKMDISDVVRWLVDNYSNYTYDDTTVVDTGYKVKKSVLSDKISNVLNRFADTVGYIWYVKDGKFYFKPPENRSYNITISNTDVRFEDWEIISDKLANDVHVFGARLEYQATDYFVGDGTTTEFKLSYIPSGNIRVFVEGNEIGSEEYEIDKDNQVIRFKTAPPSKTVTVSKFTNFHWRRKIVVTNNSGSSVSNPVVLLRLNSGNFDFGSVNGDLSDIRFGTIDGVEFPWVHLGTDEDGNIVLATKLDDITINDGDDYEFYIFYGYSSAMMPSYEYDDVFGVVDDFNYDGELDANKWNIETYWIGAPDVDMEYYVRLSQRRAYINVVVNQWDDSSERGQVNVIARPKGTHSLWVYWYEQGNDSNKHIGLNIVSSEPSFNVGYKKDENGVTEEQDGGYVVLANGVYCADVYFDGSNVSIGSRELHASYNVEVRYNFIVPIYANMQDYPSIEKYGRVSAELKLDWIKDFDTATLIASKYLQEYREPKYKGNVVSPDYYIVKNGIEVGQLVFISDRLHEVNGVMLINRIKYKNGIAELNVAESSVDIYKWSALVEHRVRQLETAGDENFFTPRWQR